MRAKGVEAESIEAYARDLIPVLPTAIAEAERRLRPATADQIARALQQVSNALMMDGPDQDGAALYVAILSRFPAGCVQHAVAEVLATWIYPRFPPPAAFVEKAKEAQAQLDRTLAMMRWMKRRADERAARERKEAELAAGPKPTAEDWQRLWAVLGGNAGGEDVTA